jgi:hypothetical protein
MEEEIRTLLLHPAIIPALIAWLDQRGLEMRRIPDSVRGSSESLWIITPTDDAIKRSNASQE